MADFRTETDSMGSIKVPKQALYGAQTQRAVNNFPISAETMPVRFIVALAQIKRAAAISNGQLGLLDRERVKAIAEACEAITDGQHIEQFPVDVFQTGSGTSSNMNMNEVIATLASDRSGLAISPNDHVNMGQSSNDVIPTAIHVSAAVAIHQHLVPALKHLHSCLVEKAQSVDKCVKTGRTHLMDAMPVRLSQELGAWAGQILNVIKGIERLTPELHALAQGGTAVGSGVNAHPDFPALFVKLLSTHCGLDFTVSSNFFVSISSQDTAVALSGQLKVLAVCLMKIANDLRWMNSGPLAGLGEIELEALQPGSSIMPGKVNPVIPEAVAMVSAQVMGNDTTVTIAAQSGNFELNVMLPLIAYNLLQSIEILGNGARLLADKAIRTFKVRDKNIKKSLSLNPILVTALNPVIGYRKAADIAKKAYASGQAIIDVAEQETDLSRQELERLLEPAKLTKGGMPS